MKSAKLKIFCCVAALMYAALSNRAVADDDHAMVAERLPKRAVIVHGGAGTLPGQSAPIEEAAEAAWKALEDGASAVDAAVAAAVVLEDHPNYNAGTGSNIRMDGKTVQMDAAVMNERGDFGAVAVVEGVQNPVRLAREVMKTPHLMLAGEGAIRFARSLGMEPFDPRTEESFARYMHLKYRMENDLLGPEWEDFDWRDHWNFPADIDPALAPHDTIGVVVSDGKGGFASASSTGGTSTTMFGRVGDVPMIGAGGFAGPAGAVAATGWGEYIMREMLSQRTYRWIASGMSAERALAKGVGLFPKEIGVGVVAVTRDGVAVDSNAPLAWAAIVDGVRVSSANRLAEEGEPRPAGHTSR